MKNLFGRPRHAAGVDTPARRHARLIVPMGLILALLMGSVALADILVVDGDGLKPVTGNAMNLGNICAGESKSGTAMLVVERTTNGGPNIFADDTTLTVGAPPNSAAVSTTFTDSTVYIPDGWGGQNPGAQTGDTAKSTVTVTAILPTGAKSAALKYTTSGLNQANTPSQIVREATLTVNWTVIDCTPVDNTPPVIVPNVAGTLGNIGWYTTDVTVSWSVSDPDGPITSSTGCDATTISTDTAGTTYTCSATSAGGTASNSVTIKRDATAPLVTASASPAPNGNGWNNTNVTVGFSGTDAMSGLAGCTANSVLSAEGAGQSAGGSCTDLAGNIGTTTKSGINIDKTAPIVAASASPAANAAGWNNTDVTVGFSGSDAVSGIDSCDADEVLSAEGVGQSATGSCTDLAGNSASATASGIKIDKTAPSVDASASPAPNANGWNNSDVTVSFSGTDGLSGISSCSSNAVLSAEGAGQSATGSCTDLAGNSASATKSGINIDKTAPSVIAAPSPAPNANGWNNSNVTVSFSGSDGLSGIASCSSAALLASEGAGQSAMGGCTDLAGNSASATASGINIDKTAPDVALVGGPVAGGSYYFGFVPGAPTCTASDALSGLVVPPGCQVTGYSTGIGNHTVTASVSDKASNSATDSRSYSVNAWTLKGFYSPVDMGTNVVNTVKGGSTVPLKFEVFAGPTELTDTAVVQSLMATPMTCGSMTEDMIEELAAAGSTVLRYDATDGQFIYNWRTPKLPGKCYKVTLTTIDGSTLIAQFKLK